MKPLATFRIKSSQEKKGRVFSLLVSVEKKNTVKNPGWLSISHVIMLTGVSSRACAIMEGEGGCWEKGGMLDGHTKEANIDKDFGILVVSWETILICVTTLY